MNGQFARPRRRGHAPLGMNARSQDRATVLPATVGSNPPSMQIAHLRKPEPHFYCPIDGENTLAGSSDMVISRT
jgi:hypothetical protein